jgi:hypothetical protein
VHRTEFTFLRSVTPTALLPSSPLCGVMVKTALLVPAALLSLAVLGHMATQQTIEAVMKERRTNLIALLGKARSLHNRSR